MQVVFDETLSLYGVDQEWDRKGKSRSSPVLQQQVVDMRVEEYARIEYSQLW